MEFQMELLECPTPRESSCRQKMSIAHQCNQQLAVNAFQSLDLMCWRAFGSEASRVLWSWVVFSVFWFDLSELSSLPRLSSFLPISSSSPIESHLQTDCFSLCKNLTTLVLSLFPWIRRRCRWSIRCFVYSSRGFFYSSCHCLKTIW